MALRDWRELDPQEVDFSGLPSRERHACTLYEVARDLAVLAPFIRTWKKHAALLERYPHNAGAKEQIRWESENFVSFSPSEQLRLRCRTEFMVAVVAPEFPKTSWRSLTDAQREDAIQLAKNARSLRLDPGPLPNETLKHVSFEAFPIQSWAFSDPQLILQFKKWLKENRPSELQVRRKTGQEPDILNKLGIWRVIKHKRANQLHWDQSWMQDFVSHIDAKHLREVAGVMEEFLDRLEAGYRG